MKYENNFIEESDKELTDRELQVLALLITGMSNNEIANALLISVHTVKAHVCAIFKKMSVCARVQAAVKAVKSGLVE